jgi:chromosome segregation ATPase
MWPKLLFDLLPHFARLMPVADKYLSTRSASEKAQEAALAALGESVRSEMGRAGEANAGVLRQMQDQNARLSELAVDVARTRMAVESMEARLSQMEQSVERMEARSARAAKVHVALVTLAAASFGLLLVVAVNVLVRLRH